MKVLISLIFVCSTILFPFKNSEIGIYENGYEAKKRGEFEKALDIWYSAKDQTNLEKDPRISFSFIDLVFRNEMEKYYEKANEIYFWGLDTTINWGKYEYLLTSEVEYLEYIMSRKEIKKLKSILKKEEYDKLIIAFEKHWNKLDPTPRTLYNEKLIESKYRFYQFDDLYKTSKKQGKDPRKEIFMRFGEPTRIHNGNLSFDSGLARSLIQERLSASSMGNMSSTEQTVLTMMQFNIETKARQFHSQPYYEIWLYKVPNSSDESVYLFGNTNGVNSVKRLNSIEDLVPRMAYSSSNDSRSNLRSTLTAGATNNTSTGETSNNLGRVVDQSDLSGVGALGSSLTPGIILQMIYYRQLSAVHPIFGTAYSQMERKFSDTTLGLDATFAQQNRHESSNNVLEAQARMPESQSVLDTELNSFETQIYTYKFIDANNTPYLRVYAITDFYNSLVYDVIRNNETEANLSDYVFKNTAFSYDYDWNMLTYSEDNADIEIDYSEKTAVATSDFLLSIPGSKNVVLSSELLNLNVETSSSNKIVHQSLRGFSRKQWEISDKEDMSNGFNVSDIIVGHSKTDSLTRISRIPFEISHDRVIPKGRDIVIYFEAYGLNEEEGGSNEFDVTYSLQAKKKGLLSSLKRNRNSFSATLNFSSPIDRYSESLEIDGENLREGEYILILKFMNQSKSKEITRKANVSIIGG